MIASAVPGRIRVRNPLFKSRQFLTETQEQVEQIEGVESVRSNLKSGSIIVLYDADAVDEMHMEQQVEEICFRRPRRVSKKPSVTVARVSKIGMLSTLIPSLALAAAGKKKLHIYTGIAFLAFAGLHTTRYSKTLLK